MPRVSSSLRHKWVRYNQRQFRGLYRKLSSLRELANFWEVKPSQLSYYAFRIDKRKAYNTFEIPRRNGRRRRIEAPRRTLKYIQRIIHESLTLVYGSHPSVHGFLSERSIVSNARNHVGRRFLLNIDLEDFFPTITRQRIFGRLVSPPYSLHRKVANVIASLATNAEGKLPQGSPSSPVISNMVVAGMDDDIANLCGPLGCWYTRYADDITISSRRDELSPQIARFPNAQGTCQVVLGDKLVDIIEDHGFRINSRKTRLQMHWNRQMCTGLVVNSEHISPPRSYIRRLRALIHHWSKDGWQHAAEVLSEKDNRPQLPGRQALLDHVTGRIGYLKMVRGQDDRVARRYELMVKSIPPGF